MNSDPSFEKCINKSEPLIFDEACLDVYNNDTRPLTFQGQYWDCWLCDQVDLGVVEAGESRSFLIDTKYEYRASYRLTGTPSNPFCITGYSFQENGTYGWNLTHGGCSSIYIKNAPDNPFLPILGAFIVFLLFGTIWYGIKCVYRSGCTSSVQNRLIKFSELENDLGSPPSASGPQPQIHNRPGSGRVKSLDVFRGLAIILMIFVNYGGGQYSFFKHSVWNGLTIADLVFPWFAWIMGVSLALSTRASLRAGITRKKLAWQAFIRMIFFVAIGISLNTVSTYSNTRNNENLNTLSKGSGHLWSLDEWGTEFSKIRNPIEISNIRIPGVLQRLGVAGFVVAILEICCMKMHPATSLQGEFSSILVGHYPCLGHLRALVDIIEAMKQWIVVLLLIILHTCITFLYKVPGCPTGYLYPGGMAHHGDYKNCTGGAAGYIDRQVFGESHLYQQPSFKKMYQTTQPYDPEGLLGTLTTILCIYLGVQAGRIMLTYNNPKSRVIRLMAWAALTGLTGGWLCNFFGNDGVIPVNKNLWSLSYVLITSSLAFMIQTLIYLMVDVSRKWGGRPLFYPGMNPLFLYIGHTLTKNMFPWAWAPEFYSHREFVVMNLWGTFLWIVIAIFLYKNRIILRL